MSPKMDARCTCVKLINKSVEKQCINLMFCVTFFSDPLWPLRLFICISGKDIILAIDGNLFAIKWNLTISL